MRSNDILSLVMSSARPVQRELLRSRRIRTQRTPSGSGMRKMYSVCSSSVFSRSVT